MPFQALIADRGRVRKDEKMKRFAMTAAIAASVAVSGCATSNPYGYNDPYYNNPYGQNDQARRAATGAAVGAVGGAAVGAVVPGVNPIQGAIAGAVLGGVLGAVIKGRQYYRDTRGYCYYVDQYGQPHYNYNVRC
jgi:hypothetical protein